MINEYLRIDSSCDYVIVSTHDHLYVFASINKHSIKDPKSMENTLSLRSELNMK